MTAEKVNAILKLAKPGRILLSHEDNRPSNLLIKGYWDHAAIICRDGFVMEAVGDQFDDDGKNIGGVREVDLEQWLYQKDDVCLIDERNSSDTTKSLAGANSFSFKGLGYNYAFNLLDVRKMFCSGLVWHCWHIENPLFMSSILKRSSTIIPQDFFNVAKANVHLSVLYDSRDVV